MDSFKIAMIGCGKLGGPTADLLEELGHDVRRFDINQDHGYTHAQACEGRDLILIAVPTPHAQGYDGSDPIATMAPRDFDYSMLQIAVLDASEAAPETPIIIISTCLPGTTRRLFSGIKNEIIYNPYLISMGAVKEDLQNPDIIIVGTKDGRSSEAVEDLLLLHFDMCGFGMTSGKIQQGTWEEAEGIKIFYNTFISTKLSLVNMIQDVAQKIGNMDVDVVTGALRAATNRITGPKYMTAGMGDGGPCHPRDNIALRWLAQELDLGYDLFSAIMISREQQAKALAKFLIDTASTMGQSIFIHGKSFKPGVPYCDGSYSVLVGHYINELSGKEPIYIDPHLESNPDEVHGTIMMAHDASITYDYLHGYIRYDMQCPRQYCRFLPGSQVVDPWRSFKTDDPSIKVIYYGNTRSRP